MVNTFVKPVQYAAGAVGILEREVVLGGLVTVHGVDSFRGNLNDYLNIKVPARTTADRKTLRDTDTTTSGRKIVIHQLTESSISVQLKYRVENAVEITDEEATLDVVDFGRQILLPQMDAVVFETEEIIYDTISNAPYGDSHVLEWDTTDATVGPYNVAVNLRKILNKSFVPAQGRVLLVGPGAEAEILNSGKLEPGINPTGLGENALRNGVIGRLAGFDIVTSALLGDDEAYAFHKSAFIFANGAPVVPRGARFGAVQGQGGFQLRWIMDYDADLATDRSVVTTYAGGGSVNDGPSEVPAWVDGSEYGGSTPQKTNVRAVKVVLTDGS